MYNIYIIIHIICIITYIDLWRYLLQHLPAAPSPPPISKMYCPCSAEATGFRIFCRMPKTYALHAPTRDVSMWLAEKAKEM